jgi:hypothetical protein
VCGSTVASGNRGGGVVAYDERQSAVNGGRWCAAVQWQAVIGEATREMAWSVQLHLATALERLCSRLLGSIRSSKARHSRGSGDRRQ